MCLGDLKLKPVHSVYTDGSCYDDKDSGQDAGWGMVVTAYDFEGGRFLKSHEMEFPSAQDDQADDTRTLLAGAKQKLYVQSLWETRIWGNLF